MIFCSGENKYYSFLLIIIDVVCDYVIEERAGRTHIQIKKCSHNWKQMLNEKLVMVVRSKLYIL